VLAKTVLVDAVIARARLELPERGHEKARLTDEPLGAPIGGGPRFEQVEYPALEVIHAVLTAPKLVVEVKNRRNKTRAQAERRLVATITGRAAGNAQEGLPLGVRQYPGRLAKALAETERQLAGCDEIGQNDGAPARVKNSVLDAANKVRGRGMSGDDDDPVTRLERRPGDGEIDHGLAKRLKIRHADQTRGAGCWRQR
jgi:hypothetical protein